MCLEAEELQRPCKGAGSGQDVDELDPGGRNRPRAQKDGFKHSRFFSAVHRNTAQSGGISVADAVDELAIRRFAGLQAALFGDLDRRTALGGHLPNLPGPRAVRHEIDKTAVVGEAGPGLFGRIGGQAARRSTVGRDHVNIAVAGKDAIEGDKEASNDQRGDPAKLFNEVNCTELAPSASHTQISL